MKDVGTSKSYLWEIKIDIFENLALKNLEKYRIVYNKNLRISISKIKITGKVVASIRRTK